jgi:hypothetical protein
MYHSKSGSIGAPRASGSAQEAAGHDTRGNSSPRVRVAGGLGMRATARPGGKLRWEMAEAGDAGHAEEGRNKVGGRQWMMGIVFF